VIFLDLTTIIAQEVVLSSLMAIEGMVTLLIEFFEAFGRIEFPFESNYVLSIIYVSLYVSLIAVFLSTIFSIPVAMIVGFKNFPGKQFVVSAINTGMGFPSVAVGLFVLFLVSSQGPLGMFDLVFTKEAMIMSQFVLASPVITGISLSSVMSIRREIRDAAFAMGGTKLDRALLIIKEARYGIITAIVAGLGRAISEVGSVLIVGGNIASYDGTSITRTLTTAIQLEARQGKFETAMILGVILISIVLFINWIMIRLGHNRISGQWGDGF